MKTTFTSESVTEGHPDKVCDRISDSILDTVLSQDPTGRVACETFVTVGMVMVGGEITTRANLDPVPLVRDALRYIGYTSHETGLSSESCAVINVIGRQSPDISQGVDTGGAGDQGVMFGYASNETKEMMPMPIVLAHRLTQRLTEVRKKNILRHLRPDGKSQVTVEYEEGKPIRIDSVVLAAQHDESILDKSGDQITKKAREELIHKVVHQVLPAKLIDKKTKYFINQTGKFLIGGPQSDTGMTGRKIVVDTYGGWVPHGGGAFSGKDPTKVDRSAAYMARYIAKNCVAAGLCKKIVVRLAYVIGRADPTDVAADTYGTGVLNDFELTKIIRKVFPLKPREMTKHLNLQHPIYRPTSAYGHFGQASYKQKVGNRILEFFPWEKTDMVKVLKKL